LKTSIIKAQFLRKTIYTWQNSSQEISMNGKNRCSLSAGGKEDDIIINTAYSLLASGRHLILKKLIQN
jgi:hypothetical protein